MQCRNGLDPATEHALFRGTVGESASVEFAAFLKVWCELPHPRAVIDDPENADILKSPSALIVLCDSPYLLAGDINLDTNVLVYADDARDPRKRDQARELIRELMRSRRGVLFRTWRTSRPSAPAVAKGEPTGRVPDTARTRRRIPRATGCITRPE